MVGAMALDRLTALDTGVLEQPVAEVSAFRSPSRSTGSPLSMSKLIYQLSRTVVPCQVP
jgi:hypothetical protein